MLNSIKPNFHFLRALVYHFQLREKWFEKKEKSIGATERGKRGGDQKKNKIKCVWWRRDRSMCVNWLVASLYLTHPIILFINNRKLLHTRTHHTLHIHTHSAESVGEGNNDNDKCVYEAQFSKMCPLVQ